MTTSLSSLLGVTPIAGTLPVSYGGTGSTTLALNSVLLGNGTNAVHAIAPGASGNVLTSNGSTWVSGSAPISLPTQTGNTGKYLTTDGSNASWTTLTLPTASATTLGGIKIGSGLSIDGTGVVTAAGGGIPTSIKTSNYTASANDLVRVNTTSSAFSVTLPSSPSDGSVVSILDTANTFATNAITVLPNGNLIESDSTGFILDINGTYASFVYISANTNWKMLQTPLYSTSGSSSNLNITTVKTSSYTASANDLVRINATSSFSITMPALPVDGTPVGIMDIGNTFSTNTITVLPGAGSTIESDTSVVMDVGGTFATFMYVAATTNWRLLTIPSGGSTGGGGALTVSTLKTANYAPGSGELVRCNTTSGSFNITLPSNSTDGSIIGVLDTLSSFGTYAVTVLSSGTDTIEGSTNVVLGINHLYTEFIYSSITANWIIKGSSSVSSVNTVLDDISNQFNGITNVFNLTSNGTSLNTILDSKDLDVFVNGLKIQPYVSQTRYPWLTPYDSFTGFKVSNSQLILYKAPFIGSTASVTVKSTSTKQTQRYPFNAITVALGD